MRGRGKKTAKGARPKAKRGVARVAVDDVQEQLADPWSRLRSPLGGKLSPAEEWKRIHDPAHRGRELMLTGDAAQAALQASSSEAFRVAIAVHGQTKGKQNNDGVDNGAEIEANDDRPVERLVLHGDKLPLAATTVCSRRLLTEGLIALDVAGSQLQNSGLQAIVAWTPWLRGLSAAENSLTRVPPLSSLGKLQELDLAHNSIDSLPLGCFPNELGSTLRRLNLEGNRLDRLNFPATSETTSQPQVLQATEQQQQQQQQQQAVLSPLHVLSSLVDLNVAGNKIESANSLGVFTKAGFPRLVTLDVRGNSLPAEEERRELLRITSGLPTLKVLNGEEVCRKAMVISSKQPMFELLSTADQCTKEGRREESCSCIEGNPCAVAYNCRDWANRFDVAAAAAAASSSSGGGSKG